MLNIKKTINLGGQSVINDTIVVYMNANKIGRAHV